MFGTPLRPFGRCRGQAAGLSVDWVIGGLGYRWTGLSSAKALPLGRRQWHPDDPVAIPRPARGGAGEERDALGLDKEKWRDVAEAVDVGAGAIHEEPLGLPGEAVGARGEPRSLARFEGHHERGADPDNVDASGIFPEDRLGLRAGPGQAVARFGVADRADRSVGLRHAFRRSPDRQVAPAVVPHPEAAILMKHTRPADEE